MKKKDITLARIKNTNFPHLYKRFLLNELTDNEIVNLLSIAIIFLNSTDKYIKALGYRIIIIYCNRTRDYIPLYDITINNGFYPIAKFVQKLIEKQNDSFFFELNNSFLENYKYQNTYRTTEQHELINFYNQNNHSHSVIIAPTSYGKTELILSTIKNNPKSNVCVITPSKALLLQTKQRILKEKITSCAKVIIHPDMYIDTNQQIIAILTQERLLRLIKDHPEIRFDYIIVDEAHNLLEKDDRANLLASVIILIHKRNNNVFFKFLTPFLESKDSIKIKYTDLEIDWYKVFENIKTEKYHIYNPKDKKLLIYDQYMNEIFTLRKNCVENNEYEFISKNSLEKNIIYLNRPVHVEEFAINLAEYLPDINTPAIIEACENISEYINGNYNLITCLKKGIVYHHGSVPDNIRQYIEKIYTNNEDIKYIVSTSTLLEGVNIPAFRIFLLDNKKGLGYLSRANFQNLIGRTCRFNEIFDTKNDNLDKLEPHIYFVLNKYYKEDINIRKYLSTRAKVDKSNNDEIENVLLEKAKVKDVDKLNKSLEFIQNFEPNIIENYAGAYATTEIGRNCFLNNITEINIIKHEKEMQNIVEKLQSTSFVIANSETLLNCIVTIFIDYIESDDDKYHNLKRLRYKEARLFYKMFLDWKIKNTPYSEMINSFYKYWNSQLKNGNTIIYVGKWGDITNNGVKKLWVDLKHKNSNEIINLAIVRIKDEQDYLDNVIMKFVEVLNDLKLLDESFYYSVKYGTTDEKEILLIKNGLSLSLSHLLLSKYSNKIIVNNITNEISFKNDIITILDDNNENKILISELEDHIIDK